MTIEDILDMWKQDSVIQPHIVGNESLDTAKLHSKYLRFLTEERLKLRKLRTDYKILQKVKYEYYAGTLDQEELKDRNWSPFQIRVLKQDIPLYIDADQDIIALSLKIGLQEEKIEALESIMRSINNRGFQIKNYIDFIRFTNGQ